MPISYSKGCVREAAVIQERPESLIEIWELLENWSGKLLERLEWNALGVAVLGPDKVEGMITGEWD